MDDIFGFFCGTVPIIILLHWHGPGPRPWFTLLAGGLGGVLSLVLFGPKFAADGGVLPVFLVAVAGGAFLGQVVNLALGTRGIIGPDREVRG